MSNSPRITMVCLGLLMGAPLVHGFALRGTSEPYTTQAALGHEGSPNFGFFPGWLNYVKNLDDEYRWNTRIVYYTYDPEFISYFGSNGIVAIDHAMAILNGLTNASSYSSNLAEVPLDTRRANYTASALGLFDLKSYTLTLMTEQLGMGDPEYFTWTLLNRALPPGAQCPNYQYNVVQRNFDPVTLSPSAYVNGNLFSYTIVELCPNPSEADAVERLTDPLSVFGSAVATGTGTLGDYWPSFTRDDVGGLRYLLRTNNVNWETSPAGSQIYVTNPAPILLFPSNLQVLVEQSLTNNAAALQALYPGLVVNSTSNFFVNQIITNVFAYFTNYPWQPVGSPPVLVQGTSYSTNVVTQFRHTFGNVLTNTVYPFCLQSLLITNIAPAPLTPPGSGISVTNVTVQTTVDTNCISGSYFILPPDVCNFSILYTQLTQVIYATNFLTNTYTTNIVVYSNATTTNASFDYYEFSASQLEIFTNNILVGYQVDCPEEISTLFQGIEKLTFVRRDYDSLLGQFFEPVTNAFTMVEITNNTRITRYGRRAVTSPDILFSAAVLAPPPTAWPIGLPTAAITAPNYITASNINALGPGTIEPPVALSFNKVGNVIFNQGPAFITEASGFPYFHWGSFDGSTNAPIVYPVGTDLLALENMAVLQITQPSAVTNGALQLPTGTNGSPYIFQLEAMGGQTPYTWSATGLPPGLTFSPPGSGFIAGTPTLPGPYVFTIRLTELGSRHVDVPMTMTINP